MTGAIAKDVASGISVRDFELSTAAGETVGKIIRDPAGAALLGSQGSSMIPGNAEFAAFLFTTPFSWTLQSPYGNRPSQTVTLRINQTFYVYHEVGGGVDDFFVVYAEDGVWSPNPVHTSGGALGVCLGMFDTSVFPSFDPQQRLPATDRVNWVTSSPITVNQTVQRQDMVVTSLSASLTAEVSEDPAVGESVSVGTQIWNSQTYPISDWGVVEQTNGATNTAAWTYHQQSLFDPRIQTVGSFGDWWGALYDDDDTIKRPPDLSMNSLQYQTNVAWRFGRGLQKDTTLPVTFVHDMNVFLYEIANAAEPGAGGHHELSNWAAEWRWANTVDVASIIKIAKK